MGIVKQIRQNGLKTSDGSGLPEPENPTGFWPFLQTRSYPNPNFLKFCLPGATRTRNFYNLWNPNLPEPEIQTRGYPTGLETLKIVPKILKILLKTLKSSKNIRKWLYFIAKDTISASF